MKVCLPVPSRLSTNCSSSAVPSVQTHQRLGFAAGEQRRAMGARQDADFGHDRTHGGQVAAVDALLGVQHRVAHHIGFDVVQQAAIDIGGNLAFAFADELGGELLLDGADARRGVRT